MPVGSSRHQASRGPCNTRPRDTPTAQCGGAAAGIEEGGGVEGGGCEEGGGGIA
jgi:hypothetical protein